MKFGTVQIYILSKFLVCCHPWKHDIMTSPLYSCTLIIVSRTLNDEQTCTPPTAHNTKIAPSRTLSDRSTSTVKSTCPRISKVMPKSINMYDVNLPLLQPTKIRTLCSFAVCRIIQCYAGISKEDNFLFCTYILSTQDYKVKMRW